MTEPANWQLAQGSTAEHCLEWPTVGHSMTTHMRGGALVSVSRCTGCGWIDFADLDEQVRSLPDKTLDLLGDAWSLVCNAGWDASSGRVDLEKTEGWHEAALRLRERYHAALRARYGSSDERDTPRPAEGAPVRAANTDVVAHAMTLRLGEQREALTAAVETFRGLALDEIAPASAAPVARWLERFGRLGEPPLAVEVEDDDESDDEPATEEPGAGESSGRWRPLDVAGGAAHLDFAEDAARRARGRCVNDTNGDGDCPACAHNPDAPCRQVPDA